MKAQKGKQGTKGQKQIVEENQATLNFYRNMVFISNGLYLTVMCCLGDTYGISTVLLFLISSAAFIGSYQFMVYMAKPNYSESGQLLDAGVDLNMEGGVAEHVKDLIILTTGCQLLSLISNYFWFFWLLAPLRAFWLLWASVLQPWFFQQAPATQEIDEKKQKKLERRMKRH